MAIRTASRGRRLILALWVMDMLLILAAVVLSVRLRFYADPEGHLIFSQEGELRELLVPLFITVAMACFGLYQTYVRHNHWDFLLRLLLSFTFAGIGLVLAFYLLPQTYIGRGCCGAAPLRTPRR